MPLARIVTACVADAVPLARCLREQGYSVEIVSPGSLVATPAEVEFTVERHTAPAALARAAEFSSAYDADVHVAPGTLAVERPLPKEAAPAGDVVEPFPFAPPAASTASPPARPEMSPLADASRQAVFALRDAWKSARTPFLAASRRVAGRARELKALAVAGAGRGSKAGKRSAQDAAARVACLRRRIRAWRERLHTKAALRATTFTSAAQSGIGSTVRTELERAGNAAIVVGRLLRTVPDAVTSSLRRIVHVARPARSRASARRQQWNHALAGAALLSAGFTLGWTAYTNRRPAADLLPGGPSADVGRGGTTAPVMPSPVPPAAAVPLSPQPAAGVSKKESLARPESDEVAGDSVVYHRRPRENADLEREDDGEVVIRHYPRKAREQAATASASGVKKISDLDE
jgi:hypothetical protein